MTRQKAKRRRAPSALRELLARQEAIFTSPLIGIFTLNPSGSIESLNPAAEHLFGWPAATAMRRSIAALIEIGGEEIGVGARLRQLVTHDDELRELVGRRRDGSTFPIDFALAEMPLGKRRMFVVFVRDISKRKNNEHRKDEFVATVSHELRTPLTSIAGSLGLLVGGAAGSHSPAAARLLQIAYSNSQRLVRLINDILDIEKIESGKAAFDMRPIDLGALVEQSIEANRGFADSFAVQMRLDPGFSRPFVRADSDRMTQVLTNLLSNAIKFSPSSGEVVVTIENRGPRVRVSVRDHGPGIPEAFRPRVFDKFAQADASCVPGKQGTGLGLNIVKQIIDLHGGSIAFEPASGSGTVFYFELPRLSEFATNCATTGQPAAGADGGWRPRVLHVDDDADVRDVVANVLGGDADIVPAGSIKEARQIIAGGGIDLAVIDLSLEDGDGIDLLSELRGAGEKSIPAVIFSGHDAGPDVAQRVDAVLTKCRASLDRLAEILHRVAPAPSKGAA